MKYFDTKRMEKLPVQLNALEDKARKFIAGYAPENVVLDSRDLVVISKYLQDIAREMSTLETELMVLRRIAEGEEKS